MVMVEECGNCKFWKKEGVAGGEDVGRCRLNPPVYTEDIPDDGADEIADWCQPLVWKNEWCGRWKALEAIPDTSITTLILFRGSATGAGTKVVSVLEMAGITTVGQLIKTSANELLEERNFGKASLNEIRKALSTQGLKLKGD